jgi:hypothetical protein
MAGEEISKFFVHFRPAAGPTEQPTDGYWSHYRRGLDVCGVKLTIQLNLMSNIRIPLSNASS